MDTTHRRPQLPALSYLDVDKVKREEQAFQHRLPGNLQTLPTSTAQSPTYHYPSGPPPPYSHAHGPSSQAPQPAKTWTGAQSDANTSPASRQTGGDEKDGVKQNGRQLLPSISEALGVDSQTSMVSAAPPPPSSQPTHLPPPQHPAATLPLSPPTRRAYPMEPPQAPSQPYSASGGYSSYSQYRPESIRQPSYPPIQVPKPQLEVQTSYAPSKPVQSAYAPAPAPSPAFEQPSSQPAGSMGLTTYPYGYTPYPPRYTDPTPPASVTAGPIYSPSTAYGAPSAQSSNWRSETSRYNDRQPDPVVHGESVKRHLDFYDLEAALNEIAQYSGHLSDFSRRYGDRMHQTQRSGISLATLPGLVEVDDMMCKSKLQLDALTKIREVVVAQQAVYEQQAADQRQPPKVFNEPPSRMDHMESDDGAAGPFSGSDTKKRRGRAAPPGRCHSCNRAETPEWRRGPDGARTLCNACGLHYAKLTRKNNTASKPANIGSSNLRPKEALP